jgi:hypothetical protein
MPQRRLHLGELRQLAAAAAQAHLEDLAELLAEADEPLPAAERRRIVAGALVSANWQLYDEPEGLPDDLVPKPHEGEESGSAEVVLAYDLPSTGCFAEARVVVLPDGQVITEIEVD